MQFVKVMQTQLNNFIYVSLSRVSLNQLKLFSCVLSITLLVFFFNCFLD